MIQQEDVLLGEQNKIVKIQNNNNYFVLYILEINPNYINIETVNCNL